jgi:hypothetical protein
MRMACFYLLGIGGGLALRGHRKRYQLFPGDTVIYGQPQKVIEGVRGKVNYSDGGGRHEVVRHPHHPYSRARVVACESDSKGRLYNRGRFGKPMSLVDGEVQRMPTSIENVFMRCAIETYRKDVGADTQFHGDG